MTTFICEECSYRFESEFLQIGKKCPYCGKMRIIKEPAAEELLNDE